MAKRNQKHEKRVKKLIVICMLSAIILTVSTYAWFIGMQTVSVNAFEVQIAAADGLSLSVDGVTFSDTVTINNTAENLEDIAEAYPSNTNSWTDLKPVSTIGTMNKNTNGSRMIIYEKSSLTASGGGYRLLSDQLKNYGKTEDGKDDLTVTEANGYVAFDLFVKNLSGEAYYSGNNVENEEAIYLTVESNVGVATSGVENTGIENSVRVAFAQIGRVKSDASSSVIQGITCNDDSANKVTGICRNATIWEPNDTKHVDNAISWYNSSCAKRTGAKEFGAKGSCSEITDGEFYPTFAVAKIIPENLEYPVDVYDGDKYNNTDTYNTDNTSITAGYLNAVDTITDSEKIKTGTSRPDFMTLAPNSITKVRVYVYIEGQDVDNYDFASLGKAISINFGFTKERFYAEDFSYDDNPDWYEEHENLYRNYRVNYAGTSQEAVKELPEGVTYKHSTTTLTIPRTLRTAFEFKDGEKTMVVTPSVSEDGTIDWAEPVEKDAE